MLSVFSFHTQERDVKPLLPSICVSLFRFSIVLKVVEIRFVELG